MNVGCRTFLREALGGQARSAAVVEHLASCVFCRARVEARDRLVPALRQAPKLPATAGDLLAGVQARIVDQAEASPLGGVLDRAMPVALPEALAEGEAGWPETLLESASARLSATSPPAPSPLAWSAVRGQILARVAAGGSASVRRRWTLGAASAAAVVLVLLATSRGGEAPPNIVFRDLNAGELASLGSIEFVVVRHGVPR